MWTSIAIVCQKHNFRNSTVIMQHNVTYGNVMKIVKYANSTSLLLVHSSHQNLFVVLSSR